MALLKKDENNPDIKCFQHYCGDCHYNDKTRVPQTGFNYYSLLRKHLECYHGCSPTHEYYFCAECGRMCLMFSTFQGYIWHFINYHNYTEEEAIHATKYSLWAFDGIYVCNKCNIRYNDDGDMGDIIIEHKLREYDNDRSNIMPPCRKRIVFPLPDEYPFRCRKCIYYWGRNERARNFHERLCYISNDNSIA